VRLLERKWWLVGGAALLVVLFAAFGFSRKPAAQYFTTPVGRGDIRDVVEATGTINAVTTVQVGSQVSGTISKLSADFNSHVKKGQVIAQMDPSLFQGAVLQARADLENARANLAASRANLDKARAMAFQAKADFERTQMLAKEGVTSQQQLDLARATSESAAAQVNAEQAVITQAQAQVSQRAAALQVAQTNLSHTTISAPIDGVVVARNVDVGQTVAASLQAPTLFTIAQDLTKMQVYTKTDESDVGQIKAGQKVTFKVDAFPRDSFEGRVSQVRMNATTVQNVVTYDTVIDFDNPDTKLFPGMTAYVSIPVASVQDVVKIPNGALRFKPDMKAEEIRALYAQYGIETGRGERTERGESGDSGGAGRVMAAGPSRQEGQPGGGGDRPPARERRLDMAIVWKLTPDKTLEPVQVRTGITDRTFTQMAQALHGELKEGDLLVTGSSVSRGPSAPGMGGGQRR